MGLKTWMSHHRYTTDPTSPLYLLGEGNMNLTQKACLIFEWISCVKHNDFSAVLSKEHFEWFLICPVDDIHHGAWKILLWDAWNWVTWLDYICPRWIMCRSCIIHLTGACPELIRLDHSSQLVLLECANYLRSNWEHSTNIFNLDRKTDKNGQGWNYKTSQRTHSGFSQQRKTPLL